jgi:hypothetical protein
MMDFNYLRELEMTLQKTIQQTQKVIKEAMENANLSDKDKEELKKAQRMNIKSKRDLENYKQKLKDDFNI